MASNNQNKEQGVTISLRQYLTFNNLILCIIILIAAVLRFHKLAAQSLWYDELQTMLNSDPKLSWAGFFKEIKYGEVTTPPFYYIVERYFMYFFGYNDLMARVVSALGGLGSILAMYFLSKEIKNNTLGLIAAAITGANYYNIFYSQEARTYTFLWTFTALSYLFFLKICKYIKSKDVAFYVFITVCLIYTHYFGFLVILSQLFIAIFFLVQEKERKLRLFISLFLAELLILIAYIPWIPYLMMVGNIHGQTWIRPPRPDFFIDYFNDYFGNSRPLSWTIALCFTIYLVSVFINFKGIKKIKFNPIGLSFVFVIISIVVSLGIPYLRSVMGVPMLSPRYTIIILPSIIIAFAYGIDIIPNNIIRYFILAFFLSLSARHLIYVKKYYRTVNKPQTREVLKYVSSYNKNYTIFAEIAPLYIQYYLNQFHYKGQLLSRKSDFAIDSILRKSSKQYDLDSFWIVGALSDNYLSAEKQKNLDTAYVMVADSNFYQSWSWAQLYASIYKTVDYTYFKAEKTHNIKDTVIAIWSDDSVISKPILLRKGAYTIFIESKGTPAAGVYPHNNLFINNDRIGNFYSTEGNFGGDLHYSHHKFSFEQKKDTTIIIKIDMDNDTTAKNEDRNTFIHKIFFTKNTK